MFRMYREQVENHTMFTVVAIEKFENNGLHETNFNFFAARLMHGIFIFCDMIWTKLWWIEWEYAAMNDIPLNNPLIARKQESGKWNVLPRNYNLFWVESWVGNSG